MKEILSQFKLFDGLAVALRKFSRLLGAEVAAYHHGGTLAHHLMGDGVDGTLLKGEAFGADMGDACFHCDAVGVENRSNEVGVDVGYHGYDLAETVVHAKNFAHVFVLAQIVVGKIGVVVDVAISVNIVEAYLYGNTVVVNFGCVVQVHDGRYIKYRDVDVRCRGCCHTLYLYGVGEDTSEIFLGQCFESHRVRHGFHRFVVHVAKVADGVDAPLFVGTLSAHVAEKMVAGVDDADGFVVVVRGFGAEAKLFFHVAAKRFNEILLFVNHCSMDGKGRAVALKGWARRVNR